MVSLENRKPRKGYPEEKTLSQKGSLTPMLQNNPFVQSMLNHLCTSCGHCDMQRSDDSASGCCAPHDATSFLYKKLGHRLSKLQLDPLGRKREQPSENKKQLSQIPLRTATPSLQGRGIIVLFCEKVGFPSLGERKQKTAT